MYGKIFDLLLIISVIYNTILTGKLQVRHEKFFLVITVLSHKTTQQDQVPAELTADIIFF